LIQWLCDGLGILATAADAEPLARTVPDSGGVVLVPAFAGLGTPHWDPHARGLLIGMTRGTTTAHIVRAAVEAMALQVHDVAQAMQAARGTGLHELRVDGGAARNQLLLEIQAALLGAPVVRPAFLETTALGAFRMAMLGRGDVGRAEDLPLDPEPPARIEPGAHSGDVAVLARAWREAVDRSKGWAASS